MAEDDAMFPNTLCSSPDDTKSLRKHARAAGLARVSVLGVHAVLDQGLPQTLSAPQRRGYFGFSGGCWVVVVVVVVVVGCGGGVEGGGGKGHSIYRVLSLYVV